MYNTTMYITDHLVSVSVINDQVMHRPSFDYIIESNTRSLT